MDHDHQKHMRGLMDQQGHNPAHHDHDCHWAIRRAVTEEFARCMEEYKNELDVVDLIKARTVAAGRQAKMRHLRAKAKETKE